MAVTRKVKIKNAEDLMNGQSVRATAFAQSPESSEGLLVAADEQTVRNQSCLDCCNVLAESANTKITNCIFSQCENTAELKKSNILEYVPKARWSRWSRLWSGGGAA